MPEHPQFIPSALYRYTETLRRQLYDAVVLHLWTALDPGDYVPEYTPDAAQLTVSFLGGRWIVTYIDVDEPTDAMVDAELGGPDRVVEPPRIGLLLRHRGDREPRIGRRDLTQHR